MAKIYFNRVKAGKWKIDDVPERWKAEVVAMMNEDQLQNEID